LKSEERNVIPSAAARDAAGNSAQIANLRHGA
jgi:hypothetical protein